MEAEFWLQRWQQGKTGFHQDRVMPLLQRHWPALRMPDGSRVLVPLAGKSLDMIWLAACGHQVLGVELSALAVAQFFAENDLVPRISRSRYGVHHHAGNIELICGDVFDLDMQMLADCRGVYDRAALIALPEDLRQRYVRHVYGQLPRDCRGLLITLEYPQHEKSGPPFSVTADAVDQLFQPQWRVERQEHQDILSREPAFIADGVTDLSTTLYRLDHLQDPVAVPSAG
ncbi:thiopurine S-methyltransferase [Pseudoxanthomonas dokdonensis]|uniref:Thiopurine S-methyltransferase n=1 Tax=Pseudoxanthomonas dokdonensis TaxID=344882 RepID=A0A0R0CHY5_9GAMM|nr:thiopurine S-methyltransferase [Pseudoxanthomonas dokdonensis]KRG69019.1 thiopurine S-methyltransferase [Pseudoxanthomonas dokdonensis]